MRSTPDSAGGFPSGRRARLPRVLCRAAVSVLALAVLRAASAQDSSVASRTHADARKPGPAVPNALALEAQRQARPVRSVSLSFSNVDVREVLARIAEYTRFDVIVTPGASGQVSISLRNR